MWHRTHPDPPKQVCWQEHLFTSWTCSLVCHAQPPPPTVDPVPDGAESAARCRPVCPPSSFVRTLRVTAPICLGGNAPTFIFLIRRLPTYGLPDRTHPTPALKPTICAWNAAVTTPDSGTRTPARATSYSHRDWCVQVFTFGAAPYCRITKCASLPGRCRFTVRIISLTLFISLLLWTRATGYW